MTTMTVENNNNKVLNVPALRFPEFTEEWEKVRLGDNCNIQMCKRIMAAQTNTEGGVPFYKIGTIGSKADAYISKDLFDEYKMKYSFPHKGEVMITCAETVGKCIIYNGEDSYYQDSNIVWIDNPDKIILNDFLYHLLSRINWSRLNSTTIVRIYNDDLRNLKLYCPRHDEQKKITKFLSLIDKRIETQNKIIEKYESLIKGLVVTHYSTIPHTIKVKIQDLGEAYSTMVMSKEQLTNDGNPCIFYGELFTLYGCVIGEIKSRTSLEKVSSTLSHGRDLLFPASTTVDALSLIAPSALMQKGIILGGDMFGIKVAETYNPIYLSYYFNYIANKRLSKYAKGTTIIHLHYNEIANVAIELPDIEEQDKIVSTILGYSTKLSVEEAILEKLSDLKQYLLKQMFI